MFQTLIWSAWLSAKILLFGFIIPYLLYYKFYCFYKAKWFY